jgi:hypothetical protein
MNENTKATQFLNEACFFPDTKQTNSFQAGECVFCVREIKIAVSLSHARLTLAVAE